MRDLYNCMTDQAAQSYAHRHSRRQQNEAGANDRSKR